MEILDNPKNNGKIIRNTLFFDKIIWRDFSTHKNIFEEKYFKRNKESVVYILYDIVNNNFYAYKNLYKTQKSAIFKTFEKAQNFILDYETVIYYNDFIKKTYNLIVSDKHPLQKKKKYEQFFNPLKRYIYSGNNWFSIYYKALINHNTENTVYYSLNDINRYELKTRINSYSVIIETVKDKYEIIVPETALFLKPNYIFTKPQLQITENNIKNISNYYYIYKKIKYFFECIFNNKTYIPDSKISLELKKLIKESPEDFIYINNLITENTLIIKEK